ncbi:hypothetical protein MSHOH_1862 [Methanosarcina horonobensis HB-1 = JCM 15518]|uniref:Uncharacterized protein n=1 Tax=Methanosarcina horonobensis HB-1 = JCM 15518 TaxID=1434110 RepID=A0A0E3WTR5_9EURY|nr:hypothetical protein MSHOH_1862 [Methanosarcina horonobensis HB-1 = JCM 15518]
MILEMMQYYLKISINKICLLIPEFILKYVSEIKNWFADYFLPAGRRIKLMQRVKRELKNSFPDPEIITLLRIIT